MLFDHNSLSEVDLHFASFSNSTSAQGFTTSPAECATLLFYFGTVSFAFRDEEKEKKQPLIKQGKQKEYCNDLTIFG